MVSIVADLLRTYYFESRVQGLYDNMLRCLDTLSEFVQGPCAENQTAVSESKFFDIANDLFSKKGKQTESLNDDALKPQDEQKQEQPPQRQPTPGLEQEELQLLDPNKEMGTYDELNEPKSENRILLEEGRGGSKLESEKSAPRVWKASVSVAVRMKKLLKKEQQDLEPWMLARLQNKCLILILSLLEKKEISEGNPIIERIIRNLPLPRLESHLIKVYKKYDLIYKGKYNLSVLQHLDVDPREINPEKEKYHKNYFETVVQNGFYIYFLISYYLQVDPAMESRITQLFRQKKRKVLKVRPPSALCGSRPAPPHPALANSLLLARVHRRTRA